MKIGVVVEGREEIKALKIIINNLKIPKNQILNPIYADVHPADNPKQIARKASSRINELVERGAEKIIFLLDRESAADCPSAIAALLEAAFKDLDYPNIAVVIKNRKFENWMIADVAALEKMPNRFNVTQAFRGKVVPNKADSVEDAESLLKQISKKKPYHKSSDNPKIAEKQDALQIGCNSR